MGMIIQICINLAVLLLLPQLSNSIENVLCKGRGYRDSNNLCVCSGRYYGSNCEFKHCAFGPSWFAVPTQHNQRNQQLSECSDMGHCDMFSGICRCREGYEGAACERIACPTTAENATYTSLPSGLYVNVAGDNTGVVDGRNQPLGIPQLVKRPVCSGHGVCRSLREAGLGFDGLRLQRPSVTYDLWDADRIQGCLCDPGYTGYACDQRQCPRGLDPLDPLSQFAQPETYVLQCRASSGHFALQLLGRSSEAIAWDADTDTVAATLRDLLLRHTRDTGDYYDTEGLYVYMPTNNVTGVAQVCRSDAVAETHIRLSETPGPRPAMRVSRATTASRRYPQGSDRLMLHGKEDTVTLQMVSRHTLLCPACDTGDVCHDGVVHFSYLGEVSRGVNVSRYNATEVVQRVVTQLQTLTRAGYDTLSVGVDTQLLHPVTHLPLSSGVGVVTDGRLCRGDYAVLTTVSLVSSYGNIHPPLQLILGGSTAQQRAMNVSWQFNAGTGRLLDCSGQGHCDTNTGLCKCLAQYDLSVGAFDYKAESSNGRRAPTDAGKGSRGDCGYVSQLPQRCVSLVSPVDLATLRASTLNSDSDSGVDELLFSDAVLNNLHLTCSGHGVCVNSSSSTSSSTSTSDSPSGAVRCQCVAGYHGLDCSLRRCPVGRSFFDEPLLADTAHRATQPCSGQGRCDSRNGLCRCRPGFSGVACEKKDCARDSDSGAACGGRGRCVSMRTFFALHGFHYGNLSFAQRQSDHNYNTLSDNYNYNSDRVNYDADNDKDNNDVFDYNFDGSAAVTETAARLAASVGYARDVSASQLSSTSTSSSTSSSTSTSMSMSSVGSNNWDADVWFECLCGATQPLRDTATDHWLSDTSSYTSLDSVLEQVLHESGVQGRNVPADPYYPVTGPRRAVSGYSYGSRPLPGFVGYDCSLFACPRGDDTATHRVKNRATHLEVQKILCRTSWFSASSTEEAFFTLRLSTTERPSVRIAANASSVEIAAAISFLSSVGNVSVAFFEDRELTACSPLFNETFGGFLVRFETEAGPLPLLSVAATDGRYIFAENITVSRLQRGTSANLECGGPTHGVCNRRTGRCVCHRGISSSDGSANDRPGNRGDCGYFSGLPEDEDARDDPFKRFRSSDEPRHRGKMETRRERAIREMNTNT